MSTDSSKSLAPSRWSGPLQVAVGLCSIVFTVGTALQNFVIVNEETLQQMMLLAGAAPAAAAADAPGFLTMFRIVGCLYILGNALGILALRRRNSTWLFWVVVAVNVTQAAGVLMVPPEMFEAAIDRYGAWGALPSAITDGGALVLSLVLLGTLVRYKHTWAQTAVPQEAGVAAGRR